MNRLSNISLGNRALVLLIILAVLLFGALAAVGAKRELFPQFSLPVVTVQATYEGASPRVVEGQVAEPLEQVVQGVEGVTSVTSTSSTGTAQIMAQFDYGQDQTALVRETQVAVEEMSSFLPDGVETTVSSVGTNLLPSLVLAVSTDGNDQETADTVESVLIPEVEAVEGVRSAVLIGVEEERVEISLDEDELAAAGLSSEDVAQALQSSGLLMRGGSLVEEGRQLSVTTGQQHTSLEQVEDVWIQPSQAAVSAATAAGGPAPSPVQLSEVADVELVAQEAADISRVNGQPSIMLMVLPTPDGNTVDISEGVMSVLDDRADLLGEDTELTTVFDQAPFINESIEDMFQSGVYGLVAAVLVILVFLMSLRSTLVIAVSIPVSVLACFLGMQIFGFTLNMLTLAAITISIGRVVDDSIVVLENIRRHMGYGKERMAAVKDGVREVATAVASSSLATIAVFLPVALVGGMVGEIFVPFAVTSSIALGASLIVALTLTPVLCYWFMRPKDVGDTSQEEIERAESERELRSPLQRVYVPVIRWITVKRKSATATVLAASAAIAVGTGALYFTMETDWLGQAEQNTYTVVQELEPGTSLDVADAEAVKVEAVLADLDWVDSYQTSVGGNPLMPGNDQISYTVTADPDTDQLSNRDVLRDALADLDTENEPRLDASGGLGAGIEVRVTADDHDALVEAANLVEEALLDVEGADDVVNGVAPSQASLEVRVDAEEAAERGLSEAMVGQMVASAFNGRGVGNATIDDVRRSVVILPGDAPETLAELRELPLTTPTGQEVELDTVADVEEVVQPPELNRVDGVSSVTVSASPTASDLGAVSTAIALALEDLDLPAGSEASLGGVSQDQTEGFAQLGLALLAAVVICYLIMVATFKSLIQPLLLLVSVPFAATGSLALLALTGTPLGAAAIIGMLMLIGIVITNAIVLMDLINQNRVNGMPLGEAIVEGARHRLRPILMTAAGTVAALVPLATGLAGGGAFISGPVAIVVIGGLISSTLLTLILVPVLYQMVEHGKERRAAKRAARRERRAAQRTAGDAAGDSLTPSQEHSGEPVGR